MTVTDTLAQLLGEWLSGDHEAAIPLADYCEEFGVNLHPFEVGKAYFFEQQTLYYVGRVVEIGPCWVRLEQASWVHWTGRKSVLFAHKSFSHKNWPAGARKPRTEYLGNWIIFTTSTSAAALWTGELPTESV